LTLESSGNASPLLDRGRILGYNLNHSYPLAIQKGGQRWI
jgi:hypothetical protein